MEEVSSRLLALSCKEHDELPANGDVGTFVKRAAERGVHYSPRHYHHSQLLINLAVEKSPVAADDETKTFLPRNTSPRPAFVKPLNLTPRPSIPLTEADADSDPDVSDDDSSNEVSTDNDFGQKRKRGSRSTAPRHPSNTALVVANFNVHGCVSASGEYNIEKVAEVITDMDCDIVALHDVEVNHAPAHIHPYSSAHQIDQVAALARLCDLPHHRFAPLISIGHESEEASATLPTSEPTPVPGKRASPSLSADNTRLSSSSSSVISTASQESSDSPACSTKASPVPNLHPYAESGIAILSRFPILETRIHELQLSPGTPPRIVLAVKIHTVVVGQTTAMWFVTTRFGSELSEEESAHASRHLLLFLDNLCLPDPRSKVRNPVLISGDHWSRLWFSNSKMLRNPLFAPATDSYGDVYDLWRVYGEREMEAVAARQLQKQQRQQQVPTLDSAQSKAHLSRLITSMYEQHTPIFAQAHSTSALVPCAPRGDYIMAFEGLLHRVTCGAVGHVPNDFSTSPAGHKVEEQDEDGFATDKPSVVKSAPFAGPVLCVLRRRDPATTAANQAQARQRAAQQSQGQATKGVAAVVALAPRSNPLRRAETQALLRPPLHHSQSKSDVAKGAYPAYQLPNMRLDDNKGPEVAPHSEPNQGLRQSVTDSGMMFSMSKRLQGPQGFGGISASATSTDLLSILRSGNAEAAASS